MSGHDGHDDGDKRAIHATVCCASALAMRSFCARHGVTITAFLDGLGHAVEAGEVSEDRTPLLAAALASARLIDAERRSRDPRPVS